MTPFYANMSEIIVDGNYIQLEFCILIKLYLCLLLTLFDGMLNVL